MTLPRHPTPSESMSKVGVLEGGLLAVLGIMGVLIVGGSLAVIVTSLVLGGNALEIPE